MADPTLQVVPGDAYGEKLRAAWRYQDFIALKLYPEGIVLVNLQSEDGQRALGENLLGLEIKFDRGFEQCEKLYIEVAEKRHADQQAWVPSGIMREDRSWLYGIGNYRELFVFSKRTLRIYLHKCKPPVRENAGTRTAQGFMLPRSQAEAFCERHFRFADDRMAL